MKFTYIIITNLLSIWLLPLYGQDSAFKMDPQGKKNIQTVNDFIRLVKDKNLDELAAGISFPIAREYPIPGIKTKEEFKKRFREIFDDSLIALIVKSDPEKDWSAVGWRGIMLSDGQLWLDYEGRLIAVNYQSKVERSELEELIKIEKTSLYDSIREFKKPICILETRQYRIRIDDLGGSNYRYVAWPLNSKMSDKPQIVLLKGEYVSEGTGGNHSYKFKNAAFVYNCSIIVTGEENSPPALLTVYNGEKLILSQRADVIMK